MLNLLSHTSQGMDCFFFYKITVYIQYYFVVQYFQVYSTLTEPSYTLQSVPPDISSTHMSDFPVNSELQNHWCHLGGGRQQH